MPCRGNVFSQHLGKPRGKQLCTPSHSTREGKAHSEQILNEARSQQGTLSDAHARGSLTFADCLCPQGGSWGLPPSVAQAQSGRRDWVPALGAGVDKDTPRGPAMAEGKIATGDVHVPRAGGHSCSQACGHGDKTQTWRKKEGTILNPGRSKGKRKRLFPAWKLTRDGSSLAQGPHHPLPGSYLGVGATGKAEP